MENCKDMSGSKDEKQAAGHQVIMNYESLSSFTTRMREAAVQGEWDKLIELEQQCIQHISTMKPVDAAAKLDKPSRQRKIQLIKKILADDADIRNHTEMWMGQLQHIITQRSSA